MGCEPYACLRCPARRGFPMNRPLVFVLLAGAAVAAALAASIWYSPSRPTAAPVPPTPSADLLSSGPQPEAEVPLPAGIHINFVDVTKKAGIDFRHFDGRTPMQYIMDQTGSGLGWLDYDQ